MLFNIIWFNFAFTCLYCNHLSIFDSYHSPFAHFHFQHAVFVSHAKFSDAPPCNIANYTPRFAISFEFICFHTVRPVSASTLIYLKRVESSPAESNMLHPGRIQVRKSIETEKYKCALPEAYLTQLSRFPPSRDK